MDKKTVFHTRLTKRGNSWYVLVPATDRQKIGADENTNVKITMEVEE